MAMTVPQYQRQQVQQASRPVGVEAATSGMGQVAQGLGNVGQMFDQFQADIDEANAKRADTEYADRVRKTLYEDQTGYLYSQGGDALERRAKAAETLQNGGQAGAHTGRKGDEGLPRQLGKAQGGPGGQGMGGIEHQPQGVPADFPDTHPGRQGTAHVAHQPHIQCALVQGLQLGIGEGLGQLQFHFRVTLPVGVEQVRQGRGVRQGGGEADAQLPQLPPGPAPGFLGGKTGEFIEERLRRMGLPGDFVKVEGATRSCLAFLTRDGGQTEVLEPGPEISREELAAFREKYTALLARADVVAASGSLPCGVPMGFYAVLIAKARAAGVPFLLDTSGKPLAEGIDARPDFIKPNQEELAALLGYPVETAEDALQAARTLSRRGVRLVCVSLGAAGSIGVGIPGTISPASGLVKNANSTWLIGKPLQVDLAAALDPHDLRAAQLKGNPPGIRPAA